VVGRFTTLRALALLLVALVVMATMVALGLWQYHVYDSHQRADALATMRRTPVALDSALGPDQAFPSDSVGVPVAAEGRYEPSAQLYVRSLDGAQDPYAVVTPLVTTTGSAILVVRGSSQSPAAAPPAGPVHVSGILEPSQTAASPLDAGRVTDGISIAALVGGMDHDLYAGYIVLRTSDPADTLRSVIPPLPNPSRWAGIRNLVYALQWWVFAAFVGFMWWRIVTDMATPAKPSPASTETSGTVAT
jgi:cytochrome oxidase assembly protein ShyY1